MYKRHHINKKSPSKRSQSYNRQIRTMSSQALALGFKPGQFNKSLKVLRSSYEPIYTKGFTTTNPQLKDDSPYAASEPAIIYDPDFDKSLFEVNIQSYSLRVPSDKAHVFISMAKKLSLLSDLRIKLVVDDDDCSNNGNNTYKRVILRNTLFPTRISSVPYNTNEHTIEELTSHLPHEMKNLIETSQSSIVPHSITIDYGYWSSTQVLEALLPESMVLPTSYTMTGHIAHLNLREEQLPYKYVIGHVMVDKVPSVETAINKTGTINNIFRNFQAEILYGRPDLITQVKERGCTFQFDFGEVYWNSRLSTEHHRIVHYATLTDRYRPQFTSSSTTTATTAVATTQSKQGATASQHTKLLDCIPSLLAPSAYMLDLFAGIGPFAIPAAYNNALVWANDINPRSSLYMYNNAKLNKVDQFYVTNILQQYDERLNIYNTNTTTTNNTDVSQQPQQRQQQQQQHESSSIADNSKRSKNDIIDNTLIASLSKLHGAVSVFNSCGQALLSQIARKQMIQHGFTVLTSYIDDNNNNNQQPSSNHTKSSSLSDPYTPLNMISAIKGDVLPPFRHIIMNLPGSAVEFLPMFVSLYTEKSIHCTSQHYTKTQPQFTVHTDIANLSSSLSSLDLVSLQTSQSSILASSHLLPPSLDQEYADLIANTSIEDNDHIWDTLQRKKFTSSSSIADTSPIPQSESSSSPSSRHVFLPTPQQIKDGIFSGSDSGLICHCYCFVHGDDDIEGAALNLAEAYLGFQIVPQQNSNHNMQYPSHSASCNDQIFTNIDATTSMMASSDYISIRTRQQCIEDDIKHKYKNKSTPSNKKGSSTSSKSDNQHNTLPGAGTGAGTGTGMDYDLHCATMDQCIDTYGYFIHHVRNVSPGKDMMCVSFIVPDYVLFYNGIDKDINIKAETYKGRVTATRYLKKQYDTLSASQNTPTMVDGPLQSAIRYSPRTYESDQDIDLTNSAKKCRYH